MSASILEQLGALKAMTIRTGSIHEAQALQLRNYPLLIDKVVKSEVKVDIERKMVEYNIIKAKNGAFKGLLKFRKDMDLIKKCVQTILWDDSVIVFKHKGKVLYDSRS